MDVEEGAFLDDLGEDFDEDEEREGLDDDDDEAGALLLSFFLAEELCDDAAWERRRLVLSFFVGGLPFWEEEERVDEDLRCLGEGTSSISRLASA